MKKHTYSEVSKGIEKSTGFIPQPSLQSFSVTLNCSPNAISTNREGTQCVVGGRNLLKVFNIEEKRFSEKHNLVVGPQNLNYSVIDVQWHPIEDNLLASAAGNGVIILWDLNRNNESKKDHVYRHHSRYVSRLCFHPTDSSLLMSCSPDGKMNCFDIRRRDVASTFSGRDNSIRDVQFHPTEKHCFCAACESGTVQLWDMRRPDQYYNNFTAHSGPAFTLHWHPDDKYILATGGRDRLIKIWDTVVKSSVPTHVVQTSAAVHRIKWRPGYKFHIASCSFVLDNDVNIWDIRRPFIPFAAFQEHKEVATGIVWQKDAETMLSCSKDKRVYHNIMSNAERPANNAPQSALSLSPQGYIVYSYSVLQTKQKTTPNPRLMSSSYPNTPVKKPHPPVSQEFKADTSILQFVKCQSLMDESYIERLAKGYKFFGMSFSAICDHNVMVSMKENFPEKAESWDLLKRLYSDEEANAQQANQNIPVNLSTPRSVNYEFSRKLETPEHFSDANGGIRSSNSDEEVSGMETPSSLLRLPAIIDQTLVGPELDAVFDDDYDANEFPTDLPNDEEHLDRLPSEAFQLRHHLNEKANQTLKENLDDVTNEEKTRSDSIPKDFYDISTWNFKETVKEMLYHYAEQGDLQMCVTVLLALRESIAKGSHKTDIVEDSVQEEWFHGYLELLYRLRLFNKATEIINHAPAPVQTMNQNSTIVHMQCGTCEEAILPSDTGWYCKHCKKFAQLCAICHIPVKGLFCWCQGCGHGGHIDHLKKWYEKKTTCPTGCGHKCEYS